ncbi:MAG: heavy-metal-associated domain-containing protein [Planctomycetes bacterium]|nr:heavy-metal-associated domain-containing protein [Planctomycetota bacterium]
MLRAYFVTILAVSFCTYGCAEAINEPNELSATPAVFNTYGLPTVEFSVPDMMCLDGCGVAVKEILVKQPGVKDVLVDFEGKTAIVAVDEKTFDSDKALAALVDKQFLNSSLKNASSAKPQAADAAAVR